MSDDEPPLPGFIPLDDNGNSIRSQVSLSDIELVKPRGLWTEEQLRDAVAVEQSLPDSIWDRSIVLERIIVETMIDPRRNFDRQYRYLRAQFMRDSFLCDLVPDFVETNATLQNVWRFLDMMNVPLEEQIAHVSEAFQPMAQYMEEVFRPRSTGLKPDAWPQAPKPMPIGRARIDDAAFDSASWTGRLDARSQAKRVLALAPVALAALGQLIDAAGSQRLHNNPPESLEDEDLKLLRDLHSELGILLEMVNKAKPFERSLGRVAVLFQAIFRVSKETGQLLVGGLPGTMAALVPAWATYAACNSMLGLGQEASATLAAGALAGHAAHQAARKQKSKDR